MWFQALLAPASRPQARSGLFRSGILEIQVIMLHRRQFMKTALVVTAAALAGRQSAHLNGSTTSGAETYSVRRGDTLSGIAQQFRMTTSELRSLNGIKGDRILIGQKLIVSPASSSKQTYTVKNGDTLGRIAQQHHTTVLAIRNENGLVGDRIYPGQTLLISGVSVREPSTRYVGQVIRATRALTTPRRPWRYIVAHHSGVHRGNAASYDNFHRRQRRMANGLAYHFVIGNGRDSGDGEIEIGNRWIQQLQGGHVSTHQVNEVGIGICLVGNFEDLAPSSAQIGALTELVLYLKNDLLGGRPQFMVHREVDGNRTLCPGKHFPTSRMHRIFG